jgi:FtsZ-binding cell division protein ZapB
MDDNWRMGLIGDGVEVLKLAQIGANADLYEKLGRFVDKAQELQATVEQLREENAQLREQSRFKAALTRIHGITFEEGDDEPICGRCAEVSRRAIHLNSRPMCSPACPECKTQYPMARLRSQF